MPDISMCANALCPSKEYCHRFTAIPSKLMQSYADFSLEDDEISCSYFIPNDKCKYCNQTNGVHKMGCETRKITILL